MDRKSKCYSEKYYLAFLLKTNDEQIVKQEGISLNLFLYQGKHMNQKKKNTSQSPVAAKEAH